MKHKNTNDEFLHIKNIIKKEKQAGLKLFKGKDFFSSLKSRFERESPPKSRFFFMRLNPITVAGILILSIVVGPILYHILTPSPYERAIRIFEKTLAQGVGAEKEIWTQKEAPLPISPGERAFYQLKWSIQRILYLSKRKNIPDEDIPLLVSKVLNKAAGNIEEKLLNLEERHQYKIILDQEMKRLRSEKNYHLLILQVLKKLKEV